MVDNPKNSVNGTRGNTPNRSNMIRSALFSLILICLAAMLIMNWTTKQPAKVEVPISEVITRANDPNGDISRITVTGSTLDITLKGKDQATETSRKDGAGTLYDQGLINHCEKMEGDELKKCNETYPTIEYKEDVNTWGIVFDVALTVLPIVALVIFFSWMMKQANAANSQSMSFGKSSES